MNNLNCSINLFLIIDTFKNKIEEERSKEIDN